MLPVLLTIGLLAHAQSPEPSAPANAANAWMKVPSANDVPDTVSPDARKLRDNRFDKGLASPVKITPDNASSFHVAEGSVLNLTGKPLGGIKEFPAVPDRCVVIATFTGYRTFFSASELSICTEIYLTVSYVFESNGISLALGSSITTAVPGGTIRLPSGEKMSLLTDPKAFFLQPGKEYLLVLQYDAPTQLFTIINDWVISHGAVQANSSIEKRRASLGLSTVIGRSKAQVISILQAEISANGDK